MLNESGRTLLKTVATLLPYKTLQKAEKAIAALRTAILSLTNQDELSVRLRFQTARE